MTTQDWIFLALAAMTIISAVTVALGQTQKRGPETIARAGLALIVLAFSYLLLNTVEHRGERADTRQDVADVRCGGGTTLHMYEYGNYGDARLHTTYACEAAADDLFFDFKLPPTVCDSTKGDPLCNKGVDFYVCPPGNICSGPSRKAPK